MLQTNRIFLSNINNKAMLKSEKTRHNLKDLQGFVPQIWNSDYLCHICPTSQKRSHSGIYIPQ